MIILSRNNKNPNHLVQTLIAIAILVTAGCCTVDNKHDKDKRIARCTGTPLAVASCICDDLNNQYKDNKAGFIDAVKDHPNELVTPETCTWKWD